MSKQCFKCGETKQLSDYYKHPKMPDGYLNKCKTCAKADAIANRKLKLEYYREYDRKRGNRITPEARQRYLDENPKKRAAHVKVGNAIRDRRLIPLPCEVCGSEEVHGHHDDYDKPLEVRWLCSEHHVAWHAEHGEGRNAH